MIKLVISCIIEVGQAEGYTIAHDLENAGKSALSGVTNVIGGATSVALVAFNPVSVAVVAGYAMYYRIVESVLGLTKNVVG